MDTKTKLTLVVPCYDEESSLEQCIKRVLELREMDLDLEIIIVDDCSRDNSLKIARKLEQDYSEIMVFQHDNNKGKGASLRTGFEKATGDFVAVQDADLEYDPRELPILLEPLIEGKADVVFGSRFLTNKAHRVLYFWHSMANKFLTFMSNMFTDLNLTDMETCYKVFRRDIIQDIEIEEDRFGVEPEIVAKIANKKLRIYEVGISYHGRTYSEGKKIGARDALHALYCIIRYNAHNAPIPINFSLYFLIAGFAALVNLGVFSLLRYEFEQPTSISAPFAFVFAALINYILCIKTIFRHKARWNTSTELAIYLFLVSSVMLFDLKTTEFFESLGEAPWKSKIFATFLGFILNYTGRRYLVFPEKRREGW